MSLSIRRALLAAALALAPLTIPPSAQAQEKVLRIGFQKFGELILLKSRAR